MRSGEGEKGTGMGECRGGRRGIEPESACPAASDELRRRDLHAQVATGVDAHAVRHRLHRPESPAAIGTPWEHIHSELFFTNIFISRV